jgi:putative ABC transport system substrate-binding protein
MPSDPLVRLEVDIIVTGGPLPTRAAKQATDTIPIVMAMDSDPVGDGFVASLAHPGGNITGLSRMALELGGKRLEFLKEIVPGLARVAFLGNSAEPGYGRELRETELAARAFGAELRYLDVLNPKDIETAFRAAGEWRADAVMMNVTGPVSNPYRKEIAELALKSGLPAMYYRAEFVEDGGLISYGVSIADLDRRAAIYVDKILKGRKPADLPVEQPIRFELAINLKTAQALGLTIPQHVLLQATEVIQ